MDRDAAERFNAIESQIAAIASATATNSELLRHVIGLLTREDGGGPDQIGQLTEAVVALAGSVDQMGQTVVAEIQKLAAGETASLAAE
jgi:hypothetical protein